MILYVTRFFDRLKMARILTCRHCGEDVTQEDEQNFEKQQAEFRLQEELESSAEYKERKFNKRTLQAFFFWLLLCVPVVLLVVVGIGIVLSQPLHGILVLFGACFLFIEAGRLFIRRTDDIAKERSDLFEKFKQKRGYPAA